MKRFFALSFVSALGLISPIMGQQADEPIQVLLTIDGQQAPVWVVATSTTAIRYTEQRGSTIFKDVRRSSVENAFFYQPDDYSEALALFRARNYQDALVKFGEVRERYKKFEGLKGNYSALAAFYQMECQRKLGNLDELKKLMDSFVPDDIVDKTHLKQIETYKYWDAVRTQAWPRLITIATEGIQKKQNGAHMAQIYYCLGLAHESSDQLKEALNAYSNAMISDFAASEEITSQATLNSLRILKEHADVKKAIGQWGTDDFRPNSDGAHLLREAVALVKLWDQALGAGAALPEEYKEFLKYE